MKLPTVVVPEFEIEVPGMKEALKFRPFLVKENKILTLALEGGEVIDQVRAVQQVISNCCITEIAVDTLPLYQLQWIFIKLKSKSVGDVQSYILTCGKCENKINYDMDINDFKVYGNVEESKKKIEITEEAGIVFKYPSALKQANSANEKDEDLIYSCIEYIYNDQEVIYKDDITKEELTEWIDNLPVTMTEKIGEFFVDMPLLGHRLEYKCNECGNNNITAINGYEHFFV